MSNQGEHDVNEYRECDTCAAKPGSPTLCEVCVHNRAAVARWRLSAHALQEELDRARQKLERYADAMATALLGNGLPR